MRTNARAQECSNGCGVYLAAGAGRLWRCGGSDSGCMEHYDSDGAWHVTCPDRAACEARRVETERKIADDERASRERESRLTACVGEIKNANDRPRAADGGQLVVDGEHIQVGDERGLVYGYGSWLVLTDTHVWYIQANGSDGADWSLNNVRTCGAGAIGWRIARTDEFAARVHALRQEVTL